MEEMESQLRDIFSSFAPKHSKKQSLRLPEALEVLAQEEGRKLVDMAQVTTDAITRVEQTGIVFIDEIDKIASRGGLSGPDISRQGVQRDLLPIVEGCTVKTKHGMVRTDHILFVASGAFHTVRPSDLIPEFQGRFPIRVELEPLTGDDFVRILTEPEGALTKQYEALLATEGVTLRFAADGVAALADVAVRVNESTENIGARRLHTVIERLLEPLSFEASERSGAEVIVDEAYVREALDDVARDEDLSRFIL
jgi:ATP-dependent HslUV protease ATP-binding subunit HslU